MAGYIKKLFLLAGFLSVVGLGGFSSDKSQRAVGNLESRITKISSAKDTSSHIGKDGDCVLEDENDIEYTIPKNRYLKGKICEPKLLGLRFTPENTPYKNAPYKDMAQCRNVKINFLALEDNQPGNASINCNGTRIFVYTTDFYNDCKFGEEVDAAAYLCGLYNKSKILASNNGCCAANVAENYSDGLSLLHMCSAN